MEIKGNVEIRKGCARLGKKTFPRGTVSFYVKKGKKGVKVFYGLESKLQTSTTTAHKIYKRMKRLHKNGISVKPYEFTKVDLDIKCLGKRIRKTVPAIVVQHLYKKKPDKKLEKFQAKIKKYVKDKDSLKPVNFM